MEDEGIVFPGKRESGKGSDPKAEKDLELAFQHAYGTHPFTASAWQKRLLKTDHYASLHGQTFLESAREVCSMMENFLFEKGWQRLNIELFGTDDEEFVITIVDRNLADTGGVVFSS